MNKDDLEKMIDQYGLYDVLEMLEQIAFEKACHIDENWQDKALANCWNRAASIVGAARALVRDLLP